MADQPHHPNLAGLLELGQRDGIDIRPTLLRVTTDLYVAKDRHTPEEERHYVELALRLVDLVDAPTRATVVARLSAYPAAPRAVLERLAAGGDVPASAPVTVPFAIAPQVLEAQPAPVAETAAATGALGLAETFFSADALERRLILLGLEYAPFAAAQAPSRNAARETIRRLESAALSHNAPGFVRELSHALELPPALVQRVIDDPSGEPVVAAAAALGMPGAVLQRILLCLNPEIGQSVQRVYELAALHDELPPAAALRMVALWRSAYRAAPARAANRPAEAVQRRPPQEDASAPLRPAAPAPAPRPPIRWDEHKRRRNEGA